ncbi:phage tail protein [Sphingomonas yabuuchiae]|uniref:Tip attachment protein J domain-containing protein n=3 Tax=Sphingomonas yabuuchiae TaxID=172044 RepID=A0AA40ZVR0_9SPHN|nr:phage tail protein [Sphingomonas yabuuchiae]MBB4611597.1 hypothetical protein [Sphingomonas yabuuchiae]MBN3556881.1 hypothetical protein [Sphingomonas yabuuchiae]
MAKALKIAAIGLAVAGLAITGVGIGAGLSLATATTFGVAGISASALFVASGALSLAAGALQKTPSIPSSQEDRLTATINPRAPRATVYGQTAMATDVRYEEWSGADQDYCDWIIALASHRIDGVEEIWLNTELAWSASRGVTSKFAGYFSVPNIVLEGSPANAFTFASGKWNGRLTGCAYLRARFKVTGNGKKATSPFSSGVPTRITIIGRGMRLYDPRRDSTVPGGNGPMRADDQSTWRYTADDGAVIGENLALHALADTLGWRIRNPSTGEMKLAVGSGVPARRLNLASWIEAANLADEAVNRSAGGTEPRYHGAVVLSEAMAPKERLDTICAACNGRFRDTGGKLSFAISHNDLATAALDDGLLDDDVVGPFTWNPDAALDAVPNVVRGKYVDATTASLYQMLDYPDVRLPSLDGQDREFTLDLAAVESPSQAQRIAKQVLQRKQYQREFTAPFDIRAWKYGVGDIVPFTFAPLSFERKLFRVKEQEIGQGGVCNMTLTVESPDIYAWDRDDSAPVQPAEANAYDASKNPLILAIGEASTTANWSAVADDNGMRPDDNATVGGTIGVDIKNPAGEILAPVDVLNSALVLRADGTLVATIGNTTRPLGKLNLIDLGAASDQARRQLETDLASLSAAVAQLATGQTIVQNVFRDAGLYTDPASGIAKLFAIENRAEQISKLSVTLNAALASIDLKATVNYVDQAILQAKLDGSDVDLSSIFVRLTSAETSISGLQASIQLKADATVVTGLQGSVTSINQSLDALNALVSTKASQTVVDGMGARLTLAEQTLDAFDGASISSAVTASRRAPADNDVAGANSILAALTGWDTGNMALAAVAAAKTELTAKTDSNTSAIASLSLQLGVQIGAVSAQVSSEQSARINGDQAIASDLATYKVAVGNSLASVNNALVVQADKLTAMTGRLNNYDASLGTLSGRISDEHSAWVAGDQAGAQALSSYKAQTDNALAQANQRIGVVSDSLSTVSSSVTSLSTTVGGNTAALTAYGQSIDGLLLRYGVEFNSNGAVTGFALNSGAGRTDAVFVVDNFKIAKAGSSGATVVFSIADDGAVEMPNVRVKRIAAGVVDTDQIVGNAVSDTTAQDFTGASANGALGNFVNITTFDVKTTKPTDRVLLMVSSVLNANAEATSGTVTSTRLNLRLIRSDGTVIRNPYTALSESSSGAYGPVTLIDTDVPGGVGTYTYQLQGSVSKTGGSGTQGATISVIDGTFVATVLKR